MHTVEKSPLALLPAHLSQSVWSGLSLGQAHGLTLPSGHALLDAQLPGGGWPAQSLTELLQEQAGQGEWRLLLPALRRLVKQGGSIVLIGPAHLPFLPALHREGIPPERLIWVDASTQSQRLWATEQAVKAACLTAVMSWLPHARPDHIRRLQSCATRHPGLLFVMRPLSARHEASAAPLRLVLRQAAAPHPLLVDIIKRKGPLLDHTLTLPHWHKGLNALIPQVSHATLDRIDSGLQPVLALH
ncbi:MAG: translesion DNA synthesis-associated protein ImuA [Acidobacteriota bacterium]